MLVLLSILSTGCWEEIHYDPSQYAESAPGPHDPIMVETPPAEPAQAAPTVQDLFPQQPAIATELPVEETVEESVDPAPSAESEPAEPIHSPPATLEEKTPTLAEVPPPKATKPTLATLPLAWQLGDQWSFAAALYAKGLSAEHYSSTWGKAMAAAGPLQVKLPPLPSDVGQQDRLPTTIAYLLETAGPELTLQLKRQHDARHAALIELATKTNVLLLIYSPRNEKIGPIAEAIELAAKATDLPTALWQPLVTMLRERAPFMEVKQSVFLLHNRVASHLVAGHSVP